MERSRNLPGLLLAFAGFVLIGVNAGASGVLIPSQIADYHVDKVTIGLLFLTFSLGYVLSGIANGALIRWLGTRGQLSLGAAILGAGALGAGLRPPFALLGAATAVLGFGSGVVDAGFNAYVAALPGQTALLNYLHAFFGVGALIGPVLAATMLSGLHLPWQDVYLVLVPFAALVAAGAATLLPGRVVPVEHEEHHAPLRLALRRPELWLAAGFLFAYVGVESTVGNWGFLYITQQRGQAEIFAGWVVSGYWLGLTLGRFVVNALATLAKISLTTMMYAMVSGLCLASLMVWFAPGPLLATLGFALLGFFLGPIFPTIIAVMPQLTLRALVPTAIGLLVGSSVVGGSVLPFVAGALAQHLGLSSLPPYLLLLAVVCGLGWWAIARRLRGRPSVPVPAPAAAGEIVADAAQPSVE